MSITKTGLSLRHSRAAWTIVTLLSISAAVPAHGLPLGRGWIPSEHLAKPGFLYLAGPRLETDAEGIPVTLVEANYGATGDALLGYRWTGQSWTEAWQLNRQSGFLWPVLAPRDQQHLVWVDYAPVPERPGPYARLFMAQVFGDGVGPIDTVAIVHDKTVSYAAAVSARRRWVLVHDAQTNLKLFYSDAPHRWAELPVSGNGADGVTVTVLDDTTALVAGANRQITWGIVRGSEWVGGAHPIPDGFAYAPMYRPRPSGGQWLKWGSADEDYVGIMSYVDTLWSAPESLRCAHRVQGQHLANCGDLSRDEGEYPAVVWSTQLNASLTVCACMPTDSGFTLADELEGSRTDGCPTVARDANGDVWVAWWRYFQGMYWTHTYTKAVAGAPRVVETGRRRVVGWTLSEPAPGSWWTVQRSGRHGPRRPTWQPRAWDAEGLFEDVARVRAGNTVEMAWVDDSPPAGVLQYRIRRDCVDRRYEWLSEEATWPPRSHKPRAIRLAPRGAGIGSEFEVSDASPGELEVWVYDVQGRHVHRQFEVPIEREVRTFRLGLDAGGGGLQPGIYFIRARDALGRESNAVKTVVLR